MPPLLLIGAALGGAAMYLYDPRQGGSRSDPKDRALAQRVRAEMRRYVLHPGAIEVSATRGCVVLTGSVLAHEHNELVEAIAGVPGVQDIYDRLDVFERAEGISKTREGRGGLARDGWSPAARIAAGAAGTVLAANVLRGSVKGLIYAAAGAALLVRAATNKPLTRERVEELLHVAAPQRADVRHEIATAP